MNPTRPGEQSVPRARTRVALTARHKSFQQEIPRAARRERGCPHRVEAAPNPAVRGNAVESVEATGRTVDDAIENALDELGLERDEVDIEILAQAGQGRPARVRVTPL